MRTISRGCLIASVLALTGTVCFGNTSEADTLSVRVPYAGLDLTTTEGASILYQRIQAAARTVCEPFNSRELALQTKFKPCYDNAIANAVRIVNRPMVTALYAAHHPLTAIKADTARRHMAAIS